MADTNLLWPGDARTGGVFGDAAVLAAMSAVEDAWLRALVGAGIAPAQAATELAGLVTSDDAATIAERAEGGGNPVIPFVALLRERADDVAPAAAGWLHRGLTSQDVLDTALVLCARDALDSLAAQLRDQIGSCAAMARQHRDTPMVGRTLTQHAVPTTFGRKAAGWLAGLLDAVEGVTRAAAGLPAQFGGAAGTRSALVELADRAGVRHAADAVVADTCATLGLVPAVPWHTTRTPITRMGDALVGCTDAWGHIAADVLVLSRPEIAELSEPVAAGRGGSSAMPQKVNPVLSVLLRRAALAAPGLAAQLHLAAAEACDERPGGAWHLEWEPLRTLARRAVAAAGQAGELLAGLRIDTARMRATLDAAADGLLAERDSLDALLPSLARPSRDPASYLGVAGALVDTVLERADRYLSEAP